MNQSSKVGIGSQAPDFDAADIGGNPVRLSQFWKDKPLVIVFLRHLGCTFCRTHVLELRKQYDRFQALGCEVVCVAMGDPKVGNAFRILFDIPFPILMTDEAKTAPYDLYGLSKGTLAQLLGRRSWIDAFRAIPILGSRIVGRLHGDGTQLAGTFIVDRGGTIRLAYRSSQAADNPPNRLLLETLGELQKGGNPLEDIGPDRAAAAAG